MEKVDEDLNWLIAWKIHSSLGNSRLLFLSVERMRIVCKLLLIVSETWKNNLLRDNIYILHNTRE